MAYIIMGRDECNMEFRPDYPSFNSEDEAYAKLGEARERYAEARSIWVEMLKDKQYYLEQRCSEEYWDEEEEYWDEEHDPYEY